MTIHELTQNLPIFQVMLSASHSHKNSLSNPFFFFFSHQYCIKKLSIYGDLPPNHPSSFSNQKEMKGSHYGTTRIKCILFFFLFLRLQQLCVTKLFMFIIYMSFFFRKQRFKYHSCTIETTMQTPRDMILNHATLAFVLSLTSLISASLQISRKKDRCYFKLQLQPN